MNLLETIRSYMKGTTRENVYILPFCELAEFSCYVKFNMNPGLIFYLEDYFIDRNQ